MNLEKIKLFKAYRFSYMIGKPLVTDNEYEELREELLREFPDLDELNQVYENDTYDYQDFIDCGIDKEDIDDYISRRGVTSEFTTTKSLDLLSEDNKSIISYRTEQESLAALKQLGLGKYVVSPKIDGIFVSAIYEKVGSVYKFTSAQSRGGATDAVDVTVNIKHLVPNELSIPDCKDEAIKFNFEASVCPEQLKYTEYKNQRSGAQGIIMSVVNTKHELLAKVALNCHGVSVDGTFEYKYELIEKSGFKCVPTAIITVTCEDDFQMLLEESVHLVHDWSEETGFDVDGVVVKKEDSHTTGEDKKGTKIYDGDVLAIKAGFWSRDELVSTVTGFEATQAAHEMSYAILFEPVVACNGNTLSRVTNIRLATLINQNINVGDKISFAYDNNTTPVFKRKVGYIE